MKLYTKAQGTKTVNLIINMEDDREEEERLIFGDDGRTLEECGCGMYLFSSFFWNIKRELT